VLKRLPQPLRDQVGGAAYLVSCRLLGVRELQALLSLRRRRA